MSEPVKLNLGCGPIILPGYINVDHNPQSRRVLDVELSRSPWPFDDEFANEVLMSGCIEHIAAEPITVMREIHRVLKPGGTAIISVPHILGLYNCMPDHRHYFGVGWFFDLCSPNFCRPDDDALFEMVSIRLKVFHGRHSFLDDIASLCPYLWEKIGVLHPDTITWVGRKPVTITPP